MGVEAVSGSRSVLLSRRTGGVRAGYFVAMPGQGRGGLAEWVSE